MTGPGSYFNVRITFTQDRCSPRTSKSVLGTKVESWPNTSSTTYLYKDNGDALDEETTEKFWHHYEQVDNLLEEHDAKKSETVGAYMDKAVKQVAGGESRTAEMLRDYMHREIMVSLDGGEIFLT